MISFTNLVFFLDIGSSLDPFCVNSMRVRSILSQKVQLVDEMSVSLYP